MTIKRKVRTLSDSYSTGPDDRQGANLLEDTEADPEAAACQSARSRIVHATGVPGLPHSAVHDSTPYDDPGSPEDHRGAARTA